MLAARVLVFLLGVTFVAACSGSAAQDIPSAVSDTSSAEPEEEDMTSSIPSRAPSGSATSAPSASDEPPAPAPPPPPPPCTEEAEPNDSIARATAFTACISGTLATSRDKDFLSVVAPAGARTMIVEHEEAGGTVLYRVGRKAGSSVDYDATFTGDAPAIAVEPGATYVFRLTFAPNGSKAERPYELAVTFE